MERDYSIDTLRTLASVLVILIHTSGNYVETGMANNIYDSNFWIGNLVDSFTRISVPLFVLISGRFLVGRADSFKVFYQKRISRIFIPLMVWSLLYFLYNLIENYFTKGSLNFMVHFKSLVSGKPFFHMWYLYMLMGLYIVTPVINSCMAHVKRKSLLYVSVLLMLFGSFLDLYDTKLHNNPFFLLWFINYLGYYLFGFLMKDMKKAPVLFLISIYVVSSSVIALSTYYTASNFNSLYFYGFTTPFVMIGALSIYKIICQIQLTKNALSNIAHLTLGIYIIHGGILDALNKILSSNDIHLLDHSMIGIPSKFVIVFSISLLLSYLIYMSKTLRKII